MRKIHFNNNGISALIPKKKELKIFLNCIFEEENVEFETLSYIFCTDNFLLDLNEKYLNHNTLTDILTFVISDKESPLISEIYISVERVKENAVHLKTPFFHELLRVMIHGILHLCGYEDHTSREKKTMRSREDYYISKYSST